jgi:hypothetical protein
MKIAQFKSRKEICARKANISILDRPQRAGIRRLTGREDKQSSVN